VGTAGWRPPEQWRHGLVTPQADLYGVGLILYAALMGERPFAHLRGTALRDAHLQAPPPPLPASFPAALDELVQWCLQKQPEQRPPSSATVAQRLTAILCDDYGVMPAAPPSSRRPPRPPLNLEKIGLAAATLGTREAARLLWLRHSARLGDRRTIV
jgi:serine/threonine-protein kinase